MRRLVWVAVGAVGATAVARRIRKAARRFTPEAVADQIEEARHRTTTAVREAMAEFRTARATREEELVAALLVEPAAASTRPDRTAHAMDRIEDHEDDDWF